MTLCGMDAQETKQPREREAVQGDLKSLRTYADLRGRPLLYDLLGTGCPWSSYHRW